MSILQTVKFSLQLFWLKVRKASHAEKPGTTELWTTGFCASDGACEILEVSSSYGMLFAGEYIKVYGVGAVLADGPWKLDVSSGRAELVQINGDKPEDLIRLDPEELASVKVFPSENGQIMVVDKREGTSPKLWQAWLDSSAGKGESKAVTCTVQGFEAFECVCFWPAVPQLCGDKPVCVWVDFKWLLTYVYGKAAAGRA